MMPHDRVTIIRNRVRARDLRIFRERVQDYFEQLEREPDSPAEWDGVRATRAQINRMLPRIVQVVEAAGLGPAAASSHYTAARAVEILHGIFSDRHSRGAYQEILDVIDMAVGVYDANRFSALTRTFNPFHYVAAALGFVAGLPRRALVSFGILGPRAARVRPGDLSRFEEGLSRLASAEDMIEARFAELREWQSRQLAGSADQLVDLAERMDFLERVLAQQRPMPQLKPGEKKRATPQ